VAATNGVDSFVRNLIAELTGVPQHIIERDSVLRSDLMLDAGTMPSFLKEITAQYELPTITVQTVHESMTMGDLIDLVQTMRTGKDASLAGAPAGGANPEAASSSSADPAATPPSASSISQATYESIIAQLEQENDPTAVVYAKHLNPVLVAL